MIKNNFLALIKALFLGVGLSLIFWNSPAYIQDLLNENEILKLFRPVFLSFLLFFLLIAASSVFKNKRLEIISTFRKNLHDFPKKKEWPIIFLIGVIFALITFLTGMTPLTPLMQSIFIDEKNYTFLVGMCGVLIGFNIYKKRFLRKTQTGQSENKQC